MFEGTLTVNILAGFLTILFLFFGSIKVFAWQKTIFDIQMIFMHRFGINRQVYGLIGVLELISAFLLPFQGNIYGQLGACGILFTSLGAVFFHFKFKDHIADMLPAIITLVISVIIIFLNKDILISFINTVI